ncbi:hypothetical protein CORC01_08349 [Colletotrichum orchidophilum]|uniref:Uncharacterized protein n=1 Tax=Colletotrichum orchidophilum TaxID=1209926 RepID=A0A1G4B511_9PEZI|nr:uncharacterized protein CORC01_08349 [Colletotrichum orchidophilum]OHE96426.1 hypothetical protein CORC01_08349 [Colletotrichum orchidophilum]
MFELPDAKRVRREELEESSEDEAAGHDEQQDADLLAKLHARMAGMLDLGDVEQVPTGTTAPVPTDGDTGGDCDGGDDGPEEFEFRLFTTSNPTTKIALVDEDERALAGDGAMIRKRPLSYYIAGEPTPEARAELAFAAVSGEEVLERARQRWWGMEQPWRVTAVPSTAPPAPPAPPAEKGSSTSKAADAAGTKEEADAAAARRRRPGKKKRIALRVKERERKKKSEEAEKFKAGKEEALKEKKKRLNRLKKLRKRAKAKEGKKGDGGDDGDGDESGSGSDGDE